MTPDAGDRRDLRRVYIVEDRPEETASEAKAVAMEEVASLFPGVIVTGVHRLERRRGGWYAEIATRMRTRGTWKRTMPTHAETKTRVTMPLDPVDPAEEQLREIRELSRRVLDDPEALLVLVGEPETGDDAAAMLEALETVEGGGAPASDAEAAVVSAINDYLGEPSATDIDSGPGDEPPAAPDPTSSQSTEDNSSKPCSKCEKVKPLTEFRVARANKDGRASRCKECKREDERKRYARKKKKKKKKAEPVNEENGAASATPTDTRTTSAEDDGAVKGWRRRFVNPTLEQLEHLSAFLGGASFDETVGVVREIRRLPQEVDHGP